jgi:hypothetical protein
MGESEGEGVQAASWRVTREVRIVGYWDERK